MPPAGFLGNAVSEFELVLDELTSNFEFVRAATRLRPRLKDMLSWQTMDGDAKQLAQRFLQQRAAEQSVCIEEWWSRCRARSSSFWPGYFVTVCSP